MKAKSSTEAVAEVQASAEYAAGQSARFAGRLADDNPHVYQDGFSNPRYRWFVGWYDEDTKRFLARLERKHGKRTEA
jgi:hypothetical protein